MQAFSFELHHYCQGSDNRPVFYVNSPSDLICSAPHIYLKKDSSTVGEMHRVGGPLYDFLKRARVAGEKAPVLIINYDNFESAQIVSSNSVLDSIRKIDNELLPKDMIVVGLINAEKPDCYKGSDFHSRFNSKGPCSVKSEILQARIALPELAKPELPPHRVINLFHAGDWKERLLGRWILDKGVLNYEEGELTKALKAGVKLIEIQNGFWQKPEFHRFWLDAWASRSIKYPGGQLEIPPDFGLVQSDGYDWPSLRASLQKEEHLAEHSYRVLNPSTLNLFFYRYKLTSENKFIRLPGYLAEARDTLPVYVTRVLSKDEWAMLLTECKARGVKLLCDFAPGIKLPNKLGISDSLAVGRVLSPWDKTNSAHTQVIQSSDVDTTIEILTKNHENEWLVIDVSECHGADLIEKITGGIDPISLHFKFEKEECVLNEALKARRKIVLKGNFSAKLADDLSTLLLQRQGGSEALGTLVLVSADTKTLQYTLSTQHTVTEVEKRAQLEPITSPRVMNLLTPFMATDSLAQLKSRRAFFLAHPEVADASESEAAWIGMRKLGVGYGRLQALNSATSAAEAEQFTRDRKTLVNQHLARSPFVFISGLSGVGKTTFITRDFREPLDQLFLGEDKLKEWAKASGPGRYILFIDEATLSSHEWSEFEGLFSIPPHIVIKGKHYVLGPQHKVIFAGNPVSYAGERKLATFFKRHGHAVLFKPMSTAVLYEKILKPIFDAAPQLVNSTFKRSGTALRANAVELSGHILEVYRFLVEQSETDVLISPRELQMMALLMVSHCATSFMTPNMTDLAKHFAYEVALALVPEKSLAAFNRRFKPGRPLAASSTSYAINSKFLITDSRKPLVRLLNEFLTLRELCQKPSDNEALRYGGLGGLVIEGESGIGKSKMVIDVLTARGYTEAQVTSAPLAKATKVFYHMPLSLSLSQKKELLIKAFNEGAVVIVDEINSSSSPMMEDLLNELLMGSYRGRPPHKPGFMMFCTQNPANMPGRRVASTALSRRLLNFKLPSYTAEEVLSILLNLGLSKERAAPFVASYSTQKSSNNLRTLLKQAESLIEAKPATRAATIYPKLATSALSLTMGGASAYGFFFLIALPLIALHLSGLVLVLTASLVAVAAGFFTMGIVITSLYFLTKHWDKAFAEVGAKPLIATGTGGQVRLGVGRGQVPSPPAPLILSRIKTDLSPSTVSGATLPAPVKAS